ncbi:putative phage protein [Proteus mirabilis HI4320]|uniref:Phage protein n=1 Tax=Proteus mirabilis (strain HI4320) TaxID=529507 RepID=B4ETG6_PROMH|nr:putative phage protein [Proteus mirabilis HI4320]
MNFGFHYCLFYLHFYSENIHILYINIINILPSPFLKWGFFIINKFYQNLHHYYRKNNRYVLIYLKFYDTFSMCLHFYYVYFGTEFFRSGIVLNK